MVTERAFGKLKSRFRALHRKCEYQKETVKVIWVWRMLFYTICLEGGGDLVPRQNDLTVYTTSNKRQEPDAVKDT